MEAINKTFNLKKLKNGSKFKKLKEELDYQKILELLTNGRGEWILPRRTHLNRLPEDL